MYGLINNAVKEFIRERFGDEKWQQVAEQSKLEVQFNNFETYNDDITYAMVGAICQLTDTSGEEMLTEIGKSWVGYAERAGYGPYFEVAGSSVREFVGNLNNMHTRLESMFPGYKPPHFDYRVVDDQSLIVDYHSHRLGLLPLALGIFEGLAKRFGESIQLEVLETAEDKGKYTFKIIFG